MTASPAATPHVSGLRCLQCGIDLPLDLRAYTCPACGIGGNGRDPGILDVHYHYEDVAPALRRSMRGGEPMARWSPLLPLPIASGLLVAGGTPLFAAPRLARSLGVRTVLIKDETRNPTRCLKDRATAMAMTLARLAGPGSVYCASAGNAAISLAAFAAHAGVRCHAFVPGDASATRLEWLRRFGAEVHASSGDYDQAYEEAEAFGQASGSYSRNCAFNPFLVEGKKTVAFEIAEQLGFAVPDLVVAPVGDGCTLGAVGKGFRELAHVGLIERTPRLLGAQAAGVSPVAARFAGRHLPSTTGSGTRAASISVRRPRNALRVLAEVRSSGGAILDVDEESLVRAQAMLAEQAAVVCELASATVIPAVERLARERDLSAARVVLVITGGRPD